MEHLGRADGRAGIADQGVRHGAEAGGLAEEMRGRIGGVADEPLGVVLAPRPGRADAGGIGHQLRHLGAGAVPRIHRQEGRARQLGAHGVGVVGGDAGRPQLLQQHRLAVDQVAQRAGDVEHRLARPDPFAFGVAQVDLDREAALLGHLLQPFDRQPRRGDHRPAHEHSVGDAGVAEALHDPLGPQEVLVGPARQFVDRRDHGRRSLVAIPQLRPGGPRRGRCAPASASRRSGRPAPATGWRSAAGRPRSGTAATAPRR
jgi:hypothetical protein